MRQGNVARLFGMHIAILCCWAGSHGSESEAQQVLSLTGWGAGPYQFGHQLLASMEVIWFAKWFLNRGLVLPTFIASPRNSTRYEEATRSSVGMGEDFRSILGALPVQYEDVFDAGEMRRYFSGSDVVSLDQFEEISNRKIDLLLVVSSMEINHQACGPQEWEEEFGGPTKMEFFGRLFLVELVACIPPNLSEDKHLEVLRRALLLTKPGGHVAISGGIGAIFRPAPGRMKIESVWAEAENDVSKEFVNILQSFEPSNEVRRAAQQVLEGIDGLRGRKDFIAVHWRRGDRAHPEMGEYGRMIAYLSRPANMACLVNFQIAQSGGVLQDVFVATNSGMQEEMEELRRLVHGRVLFLQDMRVMQGWKYEIERLWVEVLACSRASIFIGSGIAISGFSPIDMYSAVSRLIIRKRWAEDVEQAKTRLYLQEMVDTNPHLCTQLSAQSLNQTPDQEL